MACSCETTQQFGKQHRYTHSVFDEVLKVMIEFLAVMWDTGA